MLHQNCDKAYHEENTEEWLDPEEVECSQGKIEEGYYRIMILYDV